MVTKPGLVEDEVAQPLGALQQLAVDADVVAAGVGLGAQLGDDLAVDLHAALLDHLLGVAAAGNSGCGQDLLQPLELGAGTRLWMPVGLLRLGTVFGLGLSSGSASSASRLRFFGFRRSDSEVSASLSGAAGFEFRGVFHGQDCFDFRGSLLRGFSCADLSVLLVRRT